MKITVLLLCAAVAVGAVFAVPGIGHETPETATEHTPEPAGADALLPTTLSGKTLDLGTLSATPARLLVLADEDTRCDRGLRTNLDAAQTLDGTWRYQQESFGRVLYVYDDVQNLVVRIVNPAQVLRYDPTN